MNNILKTKDQLPFKYFAVRHDETQDFKDYLDWLYNQYGERWYGFGAIYYGYDGNNCYNGTFWDSDPSQFQNNPKVFSAKEFMAILRGDEVKLLEKGDYTIFKTVEEAQACYKKAESSGLPVWGGDKKEYKKVTINATDGDLMLFDSPVLSPYKLISSEEFEQRLNNTIQSMKKEPTSEKEIVGYKTPYDLCGGQVKEGTVYVEGTNLSGYHPKGLLCHYLPKEIVMTWEAVYEEAKPQYKVGDWVTIDVNLIKKDKPQHILITGNKYGLTQKLETNDISAILRDTFDWHGDCYLNSKWFRHATQAEIDAVQTTVFDMGEFELTVNTNGIYHKNDNITEFVRGLVEYYSTPKSFGGFHLKVGEITFDKTGCENKKTLLSDWIKVLSFYNDKK